MNASEAINPQRVEQLKVCTICGMFFVTIKKRKGISLK